jgi:hypothetical protein
MAIAPHDDRPFAAARARGRPWQLSVVCVAGALLLLATWLHAATSGQGRAFGPGYVPYVLVTTGSLALALWGLWWMRPWAFWALPVAMILDDAVVFAMGELRPAVVVVQTLVVLLVLAFKPRGTGWW